MKDYESAVTELFSRHPSVQTDGFASGAYKPGLGGMEAFDRALGQPWKEWRSVHVAGTNGKGSVSCFIASALHAAGLKVGLYTSPHLVDFRERMLIPGEGTISREEVLEFLETHAADIEGLSFFEITTGMAFDWFRRRGVDIAVIETGLGGRLDSTNVITPDVSVITSIGLDHCALLGDTRAAIAAEKAGIIKPGVPAVVWGRDVETDDIFIRKAAQCGSRLVFADETAPECPDAAEIAETFDLKGPCQQTNVRTALAALDVLGVRPQGLEKAAATCHLRGRWERLLEQPETICDIGHNPPALKVNFTRLKELAAQGRRLTIVYGIMADKDLDGIAPLMPSDADYILAAPHTERSLAVKALHRRLSQLRPDLRVSSSPSVAEAVQTALEEASGDPRSLVYIGGSTFVVSEAVQFIENHRL